MKTLTKFPSRFAGDFSHFGHEHRRDLKEIGGRGGLSSRRKFAEVRIEVGQRHFSAVTGQAGRSANDGMLI